MKAQNISYSYMDKSYPLQIKWDIFDYDDLVLDIPKVRGWCEEGCPNYNNNGGCPPFSPRADELLKDNEFILLTCKLGTCCIDIDDSKEKGKLIEEIISSFMNELGYGIKFSSGIDFLCPGHCRGCETCSIKTGCKNPEKRAYSITGTGMLLGDVIEKLFGDKLQWFSKESEPQYIIKIMGFYRPPNSKISISQLDELLSRISNSFNI